VHFDYENTKRLRVFRFSCSYENTRLDATTARLDRIGLIPSVTNRYGRAVGTDPIYHFALMADWEAATSEYRGSTLGRSLDDVGFVHCSTAAQIQRIADEIYRGRDDVVLLKIDPGRLSVPVRYDEVAGGERFPHVYGPVATAAVVSATPLRPGADGRLELRTELGTLG
jgi:uncharacterized protein (DUF952 family)